MENEKNQSSLLRIMSEINSISRILDLPLEVTPQSKKEFKEAMSKSLQEDKIIPKKK